MVPCTLTLAMTGIHAGIEIPTAAAILGSTIEPVNVPFPAKLMESMMNCVPAVIAIC